MWNMERIPNRSKLPDDIIDNLKLALKGAKFKGAKLSVTF